MPTLCQLAGAEVKETQKRRHKDTSIFKQLKNTFYLHILFYLKIGLEIFPRFSQKHFQKIFSPSFPTISPTFPLPRVPKTLSSFIAKKRRESSVHSQILKSIYLYTRIQNDIQSTLDAYHQQYRVQTYFRSLESVCGPKY